MITFWHFGTVAHPNNEANTPNFSKNSIKYKFLTFGTLTHPKRLLTTYLFEATHDVGDLVYNKRLKQE